MKPPSTELIPVPRDLLERLVEDAKSHWAVCSRRGYHVVAGNIVKDVEAARDILKLRTVSDNAIARIDPTPDDGYPLRILLAYKKEAEKPFVSAYSEVSMLMNSLNARRIVSLNRVINTLMAVEAITQAVNTTVAKTIKSKILKP
jgi:hypothetical protein